MTVRMPALPHHAPVLVVVVAAVGEKRVGPMSRPAHGPGYGWDLVERGQELGDVVTVSAGQ